MFTIATEEGPNSSVFGTREDLAKTFATSLESCVKDTPGTRQIWGCTRRLELEQWSEPGGVELRVVMYW